MNKLSLVDRITNKCIEGFNHYKGKASVRISKLNIACEVIIRLAKKYIEKDPNRSTKQILIIVPEIHTLKEVFSYIKRDDRKEEHGIDFVILTVQQSTKLKHSDYDLVFTYDITAYDIEFKSFQGFKFVFNIIRDGIVKAELLDYMYKYSPIIETNVSSQMLDEEIFNLPVEEEIIPIQLTEEEYTKYKEYNDFIVKSMMIFEDFNNVQMSIYGDKINNISANEFRHRLATKNGWSPNLDLTNDYDKEIDSIYAPDVLLSKAEAIFNIIRCRADIINKAKNKIDKVIDIIKNNMHIPTLIFSKKGEMANLINNAMVDNNIPCGVYHNNIESQPLYDEDGYPIKYKSGKRKGEIKLFSSTAISNFSLNAFNNGYISVLSCKNTSNVSLECDCKIVILTDPKFTISDVRKRFQNVKWYQLPTKVYRLYAIDTVEERALNIVQSENVKSTTEYDFIDIDIC